MLPGGVVLARRGFDYAYGQNSFDEARPKVIQAMVHTSLNSVASAQAKFY